MRKFVVCLLAEVYGNEFSDSTKINKTILQESDLRSLINYLLIVIVLLL